MTYFSVALFDLQNSVLLLISIRLLSFSIDVIVFFFCLWTISVAQCCTITCLDNLTSMVTKLLCIDYRKGREMSPSLNVKPLLVELILILFFNIQIETHFVHVGNSIYNIAIWFV